MTSLKNAVLARTIMSNLNKMRKEGTLCDVTLVVKGQHFTAHRVILAEASTFFSHMFTSAVIESTSREVELCRVEPSTTELLLEFIYTKRISIDGHNAVPLLIASNRFQIEPLKGMCVGLLKGQIDSSNCVGIFALADRVACQELKEVAEDFTLLHFTDLYKRDVLKLNLRHFVHILHQDKLIVESEAQVYDAAMCWLKHDLCNREQHTAEVLACVRISLLSRTFLLKTFQAEPLIWDKPQCLKMVIDGMGSGSAQNSQRRHKRPFIILFGGPSPLTPILFNPKNCKWAEFEDGKFGLKGRGPMSMVVCGNGVYKMADRKRDFSAACASGDKIYISGGAVCKLSGNQFECYDTKSKSLQVLPKMKTARHGHGSVEANGLIYICGGTKGNSATSTVLDCCEVYDPSTQQWRSICRMDEARTNHGLVVVSNKIYALGGKHGKGALDTVEYYDIASNRWHCASPMPWKVVSPKCAAVGRIIYVVAGEYEGAQRRNILEYHTHADRWIITNTTQAYFWHNCSVCVYSDYCEVIEQENESVYACKIF